MFSITDAKNSRVSAMASVFFTATLEWMASNFFEKKMCSKFEE